ncbi:hypothetical protein KSW81_002821 [Nannochloris sp. 'desiccata']|nr:hypothetical protein KSW81_002821 [Chlorella desiccata (nom. nud.)]
MRRQSGPQAFDPVQPGSCQREELSDRPRQARQIPARADIGEQPDRSFGHCEQGVLGRHAEAARLRDAHSAAHRHAIHEGHGRFGIGEHQVVETVFRMKERTPRGSAILQRGVAHELHIAPGAKPPPLGVIEDHSVDRIVAPPSQQHLRHVLAHPLRQRVQRLGAVERDVADATVGMGV